MYMCKAYFHSPQIGILLQGSAWPLLFSFFLFSFKIVLSKPLWICSSLSLLMFFSVNDSQQKQKFQNYLIKKAELCKRNEWKQTFTAADPARTRSYERCFYLFRRYCTYARCFPNISNPVMEIIRNNVSHIDSIWVSDVG